MRMRQAVESDVEAMAATFDGSNALPLEARVRQALPQLLLRLLSSPACALWVFETSDPAGPRVFSMAGGLFLRDSVIDQYLASPRPGMLSAVLSNMLDGQPQLLTLEEIRRGNSGDGLMLALLPIPLARLEWNDPTLVELRQRAPQGFVRDYSGYRIRAIYYEVFTDAAAAYLRAGGYQLLHDFSGSAGRGGLRPDCRPYMLRVTRADMPPAAMSFATQMFDPPRARLGLTIAEQRIVLRALDGSPDHTIADSLGLAHATVRSNWRSIYHRLGAVLPDAPAGGRSIGGTTRGQERRRVAIEFLRQNMHELRPCRQ